MNAKLQELMDVLSARGLNDDAVINVRDGLWAQANETFMGDMLAALTDEELQSVESSATQEEANQKLIAVYHEKTGKDMQEEIQKIVNLFADNLIAKYRVVESDIQTPEVSETTDVPGDAAPEHKENDEDAKVHDLT